ncbi:FAD-dependent oxidoreductase [Candidatus Peregrinibacteria bacterium]|nr:FAD-dependent oxidoreductase [Candidatus Peregrinibacteria bacterium]
MLFYHKKSFEESIEIQDNEDVKTIVILGGGFAGLRTALLLSKKLPKNSGYRILLVDERPVHLYTPDLYEIATAYHDEITEACLTKLKDAVAIPFPKIISGKHIEFIRDRVVKILPEKNSIELKQRGPLTFNFLVIALGSVVNYYGIPGLEEYSSPLKTLLDGLAMNCHLDMHFHNLWKKELKKEVSIVVGGGGATGVEFSCELPGCIDKLCKKYHYPRERVKVTVIEASGEFAGQGAKVTQVILKRFQKLGIQSLLNTYIKKVDEAGVHIETMTKTKSVLAADLLVWTGGVKPHPLIRENGTLPVNKYLQSQAFPNIFAAGDNASVAPMLAQLAFDQGKIVAKNILAAIEGKKLKPYCAQFKGLITPLGGKYALLKKGNFVFKGRLIWILRRLIDLRYALSILPFWHALKKWIHDTNVFVGND